MLGQKVGKLSMSLIRYCKTTRDYLVPSVWGPIQKGEDPYTPQSSGGCCSIQ
ncbi:putative Small monomeric GTPase [Rhodotorula taiwanensis]|uniref:Guanine nucleotide-binding protein subunit gamma n=1 Tax=Rhodotorula taiwanensis TaxID=741276 RepID=A0A2S5B1Q3_9BASI|nr:putative Small monomeric GTPase [Rhodotorula taiwanensis]